MVRAGLVLLVAAATAAACAAPADDAEDAAGALASPDGKLAPNGADEPIRSPEEGTALAEIVQPELLATLEKRGYHFGSHVGASKAQSNDALYRASSAYRQIVDALTKDLQERRAREPGLTTSVVTGRNRVFDASWLRSVNATFDLVGVVPRFDRRDVQPQGYCGEVRFLHRLSYVVPAKPAAQFSRMPFFFNVVYAIPSSRCDEVARRWLAPGGSAEDYVKALAAGPLDRGALELQQIEVNAQVVRVPSENEKAMGGRAEYFLRVFRSEGQTWSEAPLENTPDVPRLEKDPALRAELLSWIADQARAIDEGTALMPARFAQTKAQAFTTFGSVRKANRPFSSLFTAAELRAAGVDEAKLAGSAFAATPEGLLFRLDDMTCTGCHQGRSVAGFHFLGKERGSRTNPLNALRTHGSPHYLAELPRREATLRALADGKPTDRVRAISTSPAPGQAATQGAHCTLPEHGVHFRAPITCAPGNACVALTTNASGLLVPGTCLPARGGQAGMPCLTGEMRDGANATGDALTTRSLACPSGYACLAPEEGTPAGMCVTRCKGGLGQMNGDDEICAYGGGAQFDACAMSGNFGACVADAVRPAPRQACDESHPCREDYMCQRLEPIGAAYSSTPKRKGFCNPTYFIFQMRLDGHPKP